MKKQPTPVERAAIAYSHARAVYQQAYAAMKQARETCELAEKTLDHAVDIAVLEFTVDRAKETAP